MPALLGSVTGRARSAGSDVAARARGERSGGSARGDLAAVRARLLIATVFDGVASLADESIDCVVTSPPYLRQRRYLPPGHPTAGKELGQEETPGEFCEHLLCLMDELWRVMTPDATFWIDLSTKHAGSGGAGGDYGPGGIREGQPRFGRVPGGLRRSRRRDALACVPAESHTRRQVEGWPIEQSVCWVSHLFGASLAYGKNLLTGETHRQWVTRPPVTWCKPAPTPGAVYRTFRTGTELVVYGGKHPQHYFDLDAVRYDSPAANARTTRAQDGPKVRGADGAEPVRFTKRSPNPKGVVPLNWWVVGAGRGYAGAHYATFPPELLVRPVLAGCPEGGTVLDPFCGSGTALVVATGHGRNAVGIDLDERSVDLVHERLGMFPPLEVAHVGAVREVDVEQTGAEG